MFIEVGEGEPIVSPKYFVGDEAFPENGIIIFTEYMVDAIKELADYSHDLKHSNKPYKIKYLGNDLMLLRPFYGAPATIVAFELAIAYGLKRAIIVGEAGAINPELKITDYVLPIWGIREEGTSYHYMSKNYIPRVENNLYKVLLNNLREKGYNVYSGGVWSIDAIFRETRDKVERYSGMGVLCVDMESTALMSIADYRGVEIAILLVISDELYHSRWISGWGTEKLKEAEYHAVKTALDTITQSIEYT